MKNQSGFTLTEVIVAAGLMGIVALGLGSVHKMMGGISSQSNVVSTLLKVQANALAAIQNEKAFQNTLNEPSNAALVTCYKNKTLCNNGVRGVLVYRDPNNVLYTDFGVPSAPTAGLDELGRPCNTFNLTSGNPNCPFRYEIVWELKCPNSLSACRNPAALLTGQLIYRPGTAATTDIVNVDSYRVTYEREENAMVTLEASCVSLGGVYTAATNSCDLPLTGECPPDTYLVGFANDSTKTCRPMTNLRCPAGGILLGVDPNGVAVCGPGCSGAGAGTVQMTYE